MNRMAAFLLVLALPALACDGGGGEPDRSDYDAVPWDRLAGRIAIAAGPTGGASFVLDILDAERRAVERLISADNAINPAGLSWSAEGDTLAFGAQSYGGDASFRWYQVFLAPADGSGEIERIQQDRNGHNSDPAFSSDGRLAWLYLGNPGLGQPSGRRIRIGNLSRYVGNAEFFSSPGWSPDASRLVLSIDDSTSQGALYVLDPANPQVPGPGLVPLLQGSGARNDEIFHDPKYAPDGSRIVYARWGASTAFEEIWTMASDGTDLRQLTSGSLDSEPCWSPDGSQVAFLRSGKPHVMYADGTGIQQIADLHSGALAWTR